MTSDSNVFPPIFPRPAYATAVGTGYLIPSDLGRRILAPPSCVGLARNFAKAAGWNVTFVEHPAPAEFQVATSSDAPPICSQDLASLGYSMRIRKSGLRMQGADREGFFSGLQSLWQLSTSKDPLPEMDISDRPLLKRRAFQMDLARQPESASEVMRIIRQQARFHYNEVQLYLENSIKLPAFGEAADADGLSMEDYRRIQDSAAHLGVRVVPSLNLLGHMEKILRHPRFAHLAETLHGARNSRQNWKNDICPLLPESRDFVARMISDICKATDAPFIMAGLDECWTIGSHPLTRAMLDRNGGAGRVFADWILFLRNEFASHGKQMWMWEDMLFYHLGALDVIPRDIGMNIWHYQHIEEYPMYNFRDWLRIDSVAELASRGHPFILCCCPDPDHVHSMLRYAAGYDMQGVLVVQWEGSSAVQELWHIPRALVSQILWTGEYPDSRLCAKIILECPSEQARAVASIWETSEILPNQARGGSSYCPRFWSWPNNAILRRKLRNLLRDYDALEIKHEALEVARTFLASHFVSASCDWARETAALVGRRMLQRKVNKSPILDQAVDALSEAGSVAASLPAAASEIERRYASGIKPRAMVSNMAALAESTRSLAASIRRFRDNPSPETWPFARASLHVDGFAMDLCRHIVKIETGSDPKSLKCIYEGAVTQNGQGEEFVTSVPIEDAPEFAKITVTGFAPIALTRIRIETLEGTILARKVVGSGGYVRDPDHLLVFDRKAAIFNPPDIRTQWLSFDPPPQNWVLLQF